MDSFISKERIGAQQLEMLIVRDNPDTNCLDDLPSVPGRS